MSTITIFSAVFVWSGERIDHVSRHQVCVNPAQICLAYIADHQIEVQLANGTTFWCPVERNLETLQSVGMLPTLPVPA